MTRLAGLALLLAFCSFFGSACTPTSTQGGLSNAPSINQPASEGLGHDAIANGPEACAPNAKNRGKARLPQCPEPAGSSAPAGPPAAPPAAH